MRRISYAFNRWKESAGRNRRASGKLRGSQKAPGKTRILPAEEICAGSGLTGLITHHHRLQETRSRTGSRRTHFTARHRKGTGKTRHATRRDEMPKPILRTDVLEMKDLKEGMILKGTVRNVIDFGAFVDIGVHQDGLVHISQMSKQKIHQTSTRSRQRRRHRRRQSHERRLKEKKNTTHHERCVSI